MQHKSEIYNIKYISSTSNQGRKPEILNIYNKENYFDESNKIEVIILKIKLKAGKGCKNVQILHVK